MSGIIWQELTPEQWANLSIDDWVGVTGGQYVLNQEKVIFTFSLSGSLNTSLLEFAGVLNQAGVNSEGSMDVALVFNSEPSGVGGNSSGSLTLPVNVELEGAAVSPSQNGLGTAEIAFAFIGGGNLSTPTGHGTAWFPEDLTLSGDFNNLGVSSIGEYFYGSPISLISGQTFSLGFVGSGDLFVPPPISLSGLNATLPTLTGNGQYFYGSDIIANGSAVNVDAQSSGSFTFGTPVNLLGSCVRPITRFSGVLEFPPDVNLGPSNGKLGVSSSGSLHIQTLDGLTRVIFVTNDRYNDGIILKNPNYIDHRLIACVAELSSFVGRDIRGIALLKLIPDVIFRTWNICIVRAQMESSWKSNVKIGGIIQCSVTLTRGFSVIRKIDSTILVVQSQVTIDRFLLNVKVSGTIFSYSHLYAWIKKPEFVLTREYLNQRDKERKVTPWAIDVLIEYDTELFNITPTSSIPKFAKETIILLTEKFESFYNPIAYGFGGAPLKVGVVIEVDGFKNIVFRDLEEGEVIYLRSLNLYKKFVNGKLIDFVSWVWKALSIQKVFQSLDQYGVFKYLADTLSVIENQMIYNAKYMGNLRDPLTLTSDVIPYQANQVGINVRGSADNVDNEEITSLRRQILSAATVNNELGTIRCISRAVIETFDRSDVDAQVWVKWKNNATNKYVWYPYGYLSPAIGFVPSTVIAIHLSVHYKHNLEFTEMDEDQIRQRIYYSLPINTRVSCFGALERLEDTLTITDRVTVQELP